MTRFGFAVAAATLPSDISRHALQAGAVFLVVRGSFGSCALGAGVSNRTSRYNCIRKSAHPAGWRGHCGSGESGDVAGNPMISAATPACNLSSIATWGLTSPSLIRYNAHIEDLQQQFMVPRFCQPIVTASARPSPARCSGARPQCSPKKRFGARAGNPPRLAFS